MFPGHVVKDFGNLAVGIIGLTGQEKSTPAGVIVGDWQTALAKEVKILEVRCDILLVLSSLPETEHQKITDTFPQIDVLISGSPRSGNSEPKISGNCLITQSGNRGKYIGKLNIEWISAGTWRADATQSLAQLKQRLISINRQINQLQQREEKQPGKNRQKLDRMKAYQKTVEGEVDQATREQADTTSSSSRFTSSFLPVRPSTHPAPMQRIVQEIKQSINSLNRSRRDSVRVGDATKQQTLELDMIDDYNQCRTCHPEQVAFWQKTGHAGAFTTLDSRGQAYNLDCLPCHVADGTIDQNSPERDKLLLLALPEYRKNIGCGTCHGPAAQHLRAPETRLPIRTPARELCSRCHTADRDGDFNFATKLTHISCPAGK